MIVEEWDRAFFRILPVLSVGIGTLSVAMGIFTLRRYGPLGQRAYYEDSQYLVSVRYPGQWHELRDFVQPDNCDIVALYHAIGPDVWACLDWVCRNISYRQDVGEVWQFPSETLRGYGDCEDSSILLTSLLRNFTQAHVAVGLYQGYGHAWCQRAGQILETTYTSARVVPDPQDYQILVAFNDYEVCESYPGALEEVFHLSRDEAMKLAVMAEVLQAKSS